MLVYYFVPFIVSNRYLLFWVSNGHNSVTVQNRTHVYTNVFDHKDLGNHLLQLCPKVVKHPVYCCVIDWNKLLYYCNTQRDGYCQRIYSRLNVQVKSHLPSAGIIRSSPYSPRWQGKGFCHTKYESSLLCYTVVYTRFLVVTKRARYGFWEQKFTEVHRSSPECI